MSSKYLMEFILCSAPSNVTTGFSGLSRPKIEKNKRPLLLLLLLLSLFMCLFGFAKRRLIPHSFPEGSDAPNGDQWGMCPKREELLSNVFGSLDLLPVE